MERVFDIEADGLNATKMHCLSAHNPDSGAIRTTIKESNVKSFFTSGNTLIGHNIIRYDIPTVERLYDLKCKAVLVDTLALSWYLYPNRVRHGLASWGEDLGFGKPVIEDWEGLSYEEYKHRCESDVEINLRLWEKIKKDLYRLYDSEEEAWRLIHYLTFKMQCAAEQEAVRWKLDVNLCESSLKELESEVEFKVGELAKAMPKVAIKAVKNPPAKPFKINGDRSAAGIAWLKFLEREGLPEDHNEPVEFTHHYEEPNPGSSVQIKKWLYSLGWVPETFDHKFDEKTGNFRKIPQIKGEDGICGSIVKLYKKEPRLELLEGLAILNHRVSILKGFLKEKDEDGFIQAKIQGFTNTLRFKHTVVVNLPGVDKPFGDIVRGCLIAPEGYELCGSDMSGLEDRTKQHYMWDYDPDYVSEMNTEDFDPHLDLAVMANMMSEGDVGEFKAGVKEVKSKFAPVRKSAKAVNYSCTYGVTPEGIVRNTDMKLREATKLHTTFWKRNWSIQAIADNCIVKRCLGGKWLYNPVSRLWYSLRTEKDRFSTLNQGTGVWCFDTWMYFVGEGGPPTCGQFHDEGVWLLRKGLRDKMSKHIKGAMDKTNKHLNLNRSLDCEVQYGDNYAQIH